MDFGSLCEFLASSSGVALSELLSLSLGLVDACGRWRGGLWRLLCGVWKFLVCAWVKENGFLCHCAAVCELPRECEL